MLGEGPTPRATHAANLPPPHARTTPLRHPSISPHARHTKAVLGEGGSAVLEGQRALPARLAEAGFAFKHPRADGAVRHLFR